MQNYWEKLAYERRELSACESEPIQFCGAIQDAGWYLACEKDSGNLIAFSENFETFTGKSKTSLFESRVRDFFSFEDGSTLNLATCLEYSQSGAIKLKLADDEGFVFANFSETDNFLCVDIESVGHHTNVDPLQFVERLKKLIFQIDLEVDPSKMLSRAAGQLRELTGFDRVMIYRFEPNWDGEVVAEDVDPEFPPFLGLRYPASDIPAQARAIYLNSRYRMIVDTHSLPVPVVTNSRLKRSELDLTCSALRAVSPFHIQYLINMGVRSSFSFPLKVNGKLWGLISCHHYGAAMHLSRELRSSCELAAQVISGRLVDQIVDRRHRIKNSVLNLTHSILSKVTEGKTPIESFKDVAADLLSMTESAGLYVRMGGESIVFGETPATGYIESMIEKLRNIDSLSIWSSDDVATDLEIPKATKAAGAMAVPFSFGFSDLIIWFRPEHIREVKWGGNPHEKASSQDILNPRSSFKAWTERVAGHSREWNESAQETAQHLLFMFVKGIFQKASELSKANIELERVTQAKDEFIGMVSHELRTPLGVMIGWIDILRDEWGAEPNIMQGLDIIDRNAKLQINLINDLLDVSRIISGKLRLNLQPNIKIQNVIQDVVKDLGPTAAAKGIQIKIHQDKEVAAHADPDRLRQIVWNLISNSVKFTPETGKISVHLESHPGSYQITVQDNGVGIESSQLQRIFDRFAQSREGHASLGGLGLGLSIVRSLVELHGGVITAFSEGKNRGSKFTASFPVQSEYRLESEETELKNEGRGHELAGLKILLAEDQGDAASALDYYLRKAGAKTVVVADGKLALEMLATATFDVLVSDIGMPHIDGLELIRTIRSREKNEGRLSMPAIALTAYATSKDRIKCLSAGFQSHIAKPVDRDELLAVIQSVVVKD